MKVKHSYIIVVCLLLVLVTACSINGAVSENTNKEEKHVEHGDDKNEQQEVQADHVHNDIREETSSIDVLPNFMSNKPKDMKLIYKAAAKNKELLENIPCYCGCGESSNHKNNYDCFIFENRENGALVWDDHGTKCGVCLEIAAQSINDYSKGKSIKEIRDEIDKKYENGYATPTPTPEV